ncbi:aminodeoxychorismate lyase family protein [Asticcacaulis biprosthecium C19]|uniref:Endolytic murein transglycosylase n=1 Tax=Asticcacaulis biprosthecium C19 TaxID=715226 RepID=F4QRD8_9CAUL|nr:endolytic transglycosylase MltG [Asticcacaulis biprosthecium]EGF90775.1 aminodeoxychorismate lyase family protein [Asticcacaulis biprosthecium C19]
MIRWLRRDGKAAPAKGGTGALLAPVAGLVAGIVLLIMAGGMFFYAQLYGPGPKLADNAAVKEVTFQRGTSVTAMSEALEKQGVIRSANLFRIVAKMRGHANRLRAGTYAFPAGDSLVDVLVRMETGKVVRNFVTIPEGKTSAQVVRLLMAQEHLTGEIETPPEGAILPETYEFQRGETREAVLDRMLDAGRKTLDDLWAKRAPDLPFKNKEEALIMASIVERETGLAAERPRVAAVFVNRLKQGVRLGSDPTVIYGVSRGEPLGRGLTRTELDTWSPWNTYQIDKLPVTPIANPGRAAIAATLNPAKTTDLYFVADGTGGHVFAATYEEHLANVAKWRQIESEVSRYSTPAVDSASAVASSPTSGDGAKTQAAIRLQGKSH